MPNEIKEITATLKSVSQEKKRHVFAFENPEGGEYDFKVSAFPPHVPQLEIGKDYLFKCEFKPVPNEEGKFYKNFVRKTRDGPYDILELDEKGDAHELGAPKGDICQPAPMGEPEKKETILKAEHVSMTFTHPEEAYWKARKEREDAYWKERGEREKADQSIREWNIRRLACQHDAAQIVAATLQPVQTTKEREKALVEATIAIGEITAKLQEQHEEAEAKRRMGSLKSPSEKKPAPAQQEESILAGEGGEPNTRRAKEAGA